jgi:hypothetical protein
LSGPAIPLLNNLRDDVGVWRSIFSVSQNGLMTYQTGSVSAVKSQMAWFDRAGTPTPACNPEEKGIVDVRVVRAPERAPILGDRRTPPVRVGDWAALLRAKS